MILWTRVVKTRLRREVTVSDMAAYGFMLRKKYKEGQRELHCVFVDLEKGYGAKRVGYCMRISGVAEKYVKVVQDMYEDSETAVRCVVVT